LNLTESARQWVLKNLPYDRQDAALGVYLQGLDAHGLLVVFHNWAHRLIKPQPRQVHQSMAYRQNPRTAECASDLARIIADIEQGRDLTKYLSRDIERAPAKAPGACRRPDLDLLLNDWGVHHLHISSIVEPNGFVKRDGPLLFVSFTSHAAYVIDIMVHGDWTRAHVLEVLAKEWPTEGVLHEIRGVTGLKNQITEEQRATLRRKWTSTWFEFGGKVFAPIGGMSGAGTTIAATRESDMLLDRIRVFEEAIGRNPRCLEADFARSGLVLPKDPQFKFAIREDGAGVIETQTGAWINLTNNRNQ
jgi:hypothetical protein